MNSQRKRREDLLRDIREKESELGALEKSLDFLHRQYNEIKYLPPEERECQYNLIRRNISNVENSIRWCENDLRMMREGYNEVNL